MHYTTELTIDLPRDRIIELFDSVENLYKWQPELISFEHLSGDPGEVGARSKLVYKMGRREMEMIETVTHKNLPENFSGTYEAKGVFNAVSNQFDVINSTKTRWIVETECQFSGIMKILSIFMKGSFRKQTRLFMDRFKNFAESEG